MQKEGFKVKIYDINKKMENKKHTMKHYAKRILFSGVWITALLILIEFFMLLALFWRFTEYSGFIFEAMIIGGVAVMIYIINEKSNPAYKIAWIIPIMLFPLVGSMLYLFVKLNFGNLAAKGILQRNIKETAKYAKTSEEIRIEIEAEESKFLKVANYIENAGGYPTWKNTSMKYYPLADYIQNPILEELEKAEEYIFLEYFMIEEGAFWNPILEVLERKAAEGLDVRVIYDDFGSVALLPRKYHVLLKEKGIQAKKYAKLSPFLSTHLNNRDHRKMIIIDGKVAISGGFNLCDEYINAYEKYGHWKDNGFVIKGEAVYNYALMFLQMWNSMDMEKTQDYAKYLEKSRYSVSAPGYIIPYGDGPHQEENVAEQVYMDIISRATKYVYIMTPYLILDHEMKQCLMHASKSGVDVRIIMPHVPDKKSVFAIARTYYPQLIKSGVKIYEYVPGFVHAKTFLADDEVAVVGTINLDFRSMYLHYECGSLFYRTEGLSDIKSDFVETFDKCQQITMKDYYRFPLHQKLVGRTLRIIGPLL